MSNTVRKILPGSKKTGGLAGSAGEQMMNKLVEMEQEKKESALSAQQTAAQQGAAAARKKRGGRTGQRSLLYASRLGGGAGRGEDQTTLGAG